MKIKNVLMSVIILGSCQYTMPYILTMNNETDGDLVAEIERARPDICAPLMVLVERGHTKQFDTGGCCLGDVKIEKISGSNVGTTTVYQTEITNSDMSCKSSRFVVRDKSGRIITLTY